MYLYITGYPIRTSPDHRSLSTSLKLFAACHVLHRQWKPRHPPCTLTYFLFSRFSFFYFLPLFLPTYFFTFFCFFLSSSFLSLVSPSPLSMLIYYLFKINAMENIGFEPMTPSLQSWCSSQLS